MTPETRDLITWLIATILGLSAVVGLLVRLILLPYLRQHLVEPMRQVEKQVTENHHSNETPTVLDRIDDVQQSVDDVRADVKILRDAFKGHTDWSQDWTSLAEKRITLLENRRRWWE